MFIITGDRERARATQVTSWKSSVMDEAWVIMYHNFEKWKARTTGTVNHKRLIVLKRPPQQDQVGAGCGADAALTTGPDGSSGWYGTSLPARGGEGPDRMVTS
jgi:hypothetical protein